jgi:hypothetical protein
MTTNSCSTYRKFETNQSQNPLLAVAKWFWNFSNFYGEYNTVAPSARRNYVKSLEQDQHN